MEEGNEPKILSYSLPRTLERETSFCLYCEATPIPKPMRWAGMYNPLHLVRRETESPGEE
jgi:hypothetical protein